MKTLRYALLVLAGLFLAAQPGQAQIICDKTAQYDTNTNGATKLITGTSTNTVYVCGYTIVSGGTVGVGFVTGTGTNCATDQAAITPVYSVVAQSIITESAASFRGLRAAPGIDLCIKTNAGTAVGAILYYAQK